MRLFLFFALSLVLHSEVVVAKVSVVSLEEVIRDWDSLQIVDARSESEYQKNHLPGAVRMDWRDYREEALYLKERVLGVSSGQVLSNPQKIETLLTGLGLREDLPILVYGGESRWGEEGRIAWNLLYWGAKDVRLLDGGWRTWEMARPKLKRIHHSKKSFTVKLNPERRIHFRQVKQSTLEKKLIIDVRSDSEFKEQQIPTALHFLDKMLYRADGKFPDKNELEKIIPRIGSAEVFYCAGGVRSALAAVLVEASFGKVVKNYDGSMWDWKKIPGDFSPGEALKIILRRSRWIG